MNCGSEVPDGVRFCNNCGEEVAPPAGPEEGISVEPEETESVELEQADDEEFESPVADDKPKLSFNTGTSGGFGYEFAGDPVDDLPSAGSSGMDIYDPEKEKKKKGQKITGLGFSTELMEDAQVKDVERKKKEGERQRAEQVAKKKREALQQQLLEEQLRQAETERVQQEIESAREASIFNRPNFWIIAAAVLLVPALLLPWIKFYDNGLISAFRIPVSFLFVDNLTFLSFLNVGFVLIFLLLLLLVPVLLSRRIAVILQFVAVLSLLLGVGGLLLGLRHWNAMAGLGGGYERYLQEREPGLQKELIPMYVMRGEPGAPAGENAAGGPGFMFKVLGPGVLFALLSGAMVLWAVMRFSYEMSHVEFAMPSAVGAVLLILGIMLICLFSFARLMPARWFYLQSRVMRVLNRPDAANHRLELCIELPVPDTICKNSLAVFYREDGRTREAETLFLEIVGSRPDYAPARRELGDLYYGGKNYWKAAEHYRKYFEHAKGGDETRQKMSSALTFIANEKYSGKEYKPAVRLFEEALDIYRPNRKDTALLYKIGDAYYKLKDYGNALEYFSRTAMLKPEDFEFQIMVAKVYEQQKDYENAMKYYQRSIDAQPDHSYSYIYIGNLYRSALNDPKKAEEWYRKAIEANEVSNGAIEARRLLDDLNK